MSLNRIVVVCLLVGGMLFSAGARLMAQDDTSIEWMTWQDAIEKSKVQKKKFLVSIYTDWCGWCRRMDANTFSNPEIVRYINKYYYAIKFNGGSRDEIEWKGKVYKYVSNGKRGYHQLAAEIMQGQIAYPTVVFLNEKMEVIQPIPGYKEPDQFEIIMNYFAGNHYKTTPWRKYAEDFKDSKIVPVNGH